MTPLPDVHVAAEESARRLLAALRGRSDA